MRQILLVVTFLHGSAIWATETTPEHSPLTACAVLEPPWAYVDEAGTPTGIAVDLHSRFHQITHRVILTKLCTMKSVAAGLEDGSIDLAILPETKELEQWADPVLSVYRARTMVLPRKGVLVQRYEDLGGLTVAAAEGLDLGARLEGDSRVTKMRVPVAGDGLSLLIDEGADAVVGNANFYRFAAMHRGIDPGELFGPPFLLGEHTVWVYVSRKTDAPPFAAALQSALSEVSLDEMIRELRDRYYQKAMAGG